MRLLLGNEELTGNTNRNIDETEKNAKRFVQVDSQIQLCGIGSFYFGYSQD